MVAGAGVSAEPGQYAKLTVPEVGQATNPAFVPPGGALKAHVTVSIEETPVAAIVTVVPHLPAEIAAVVIAAVPLATV
jgi:hypothetical protein